METPALIRLFARHKTAANLFMILVLLLGFVSMNRMNVQFLPDFGIDIVTVSVNWPGATAEDIDSAIIQAIEPEVRFLDGVKRVRSTATEGRALTVVEFLPGADMQSALSDVETGIGQVVTLPEEAERPVVRRVVRYDSLARLVISGPYPESTLKALAKRIRDDLLDRGLQKVDLFGARDEEILVEIAPETLMRLDMTLDEVARRIQATSRDVPAGNIRGGDERQIRSLGLLRDADSLGRIDLRSLPDGDTIRLSDVATIQEGFNTDDPQGRFRGVRAIEINVQRAVTADALEQAAILDAYLEELRPTLPEALRIDLHSVSSDMIRERIDLLLVNGLSGLALVVAVLFLFLNARIAVWVAAGIPISLMASMIVMYLTGQSINMISLFGMIMAIGIIVDEAIVVGEHTETRYRSGLPPLAAAEAGATRMAAPVVSAALTTIAAFMPILVMGDIIGTIIAAIPLVVIAMICASVIEVFLILPAHLRGALSRMPPEPTRFRKAFDSGFARFRDTVFAPFIALVLRWRYLTLSCAVGLLILAVGLLQGGRVAFHFFPSPESDIIYANIEMVAGTPRSETEKMVDELARAAEEAEALLTGGRGGVIRMSFARIGMSTGTGEGTYDRGDMIGGLVVELEPSDRREIRTRDMIAAWQDSLRPRAGLESVNIASPIGGPPGRELDIRLSGASPDRLKEAALELRGLLQRYPGVRNLEDDLPFGKREEILELTPHGRALGFTTEEVAAQIRAAYQGIIAQRFAREDEEVLVRVQFPRARADGATLDTLYLRSPGGAMAALSEVVVRRTERGFSRIQREDGLRQVAITGDIDERVTSTSRVIEALERDGIAEIARAYGVSYRFAGKAEEQAEALGDMRTGSVIGLAMIYIVLAWVFGSFSRPLVVMSVIPFGVIGAVFGHWLLGFDLTILSLIALLGLAGIIVNGSIILVTVIDEKIRAGEQLSAAIVDGARERLRAVILTSATTIGGLLPLLFERSFQAQFLIPMAITIVFGLLVGTLLVLVIVPALLGIQDDLGRLLRRGFVPLRPSARTASGAR